MNRKHKVLFVTIVPSPYQRDLFRALAARAEIDLSIYYMEPASPDSPWPEVSLQPYERILSGFWIPLGGVRWHVNWNLPDLSSFDYVVLSSYTSLTGQWLMRGKLRDQRWVFWGEQLRQQTQPLRRAVQEKLTAPLADATAIVGVGHAAKRDYESRFPNTRHFCVPYYCDLSAFLAWPRRPAPTSEIRFLFCGQMTKRKGIDLLLTAFDRLIGDGNDVSLLLVGREAELQQHLARISASARAKVQYAGFQAPENLPEYFSQADAFVLPSRYDGWGVVVNQALGAGLPVICSDAVGAGLDLVEENVNGLRFPSENLDELERCMRQVASSPGVTWTWGEASRQKALALSPEVGAARWVEIFQSLSSAQ